MKRLKQRARRRVFRELDRLIAQRQSDRNQSAVGRPGKPSRDPRDLNRPFSRSGHA